MPDCTHFWHVPSPDDAAVHEGQAVARCRRCGATRTFTVTPHDPETRWRAYQHTTESIRGEVIA